MEIQRKIEEYDALVRRANKIVQDYNRYPLMPQGNLSIEFIQNVFNFNPLFVLDELKQFLINTLLEVTQYRYSEEELQPIINETYIKHERDHKIRILKTLIENYKKDLAWISFRHTSYMQLRREETVVFYYAFSIFYIAKELNNGSALLFSRQVLKAVDLFYCERSTTPIDGFTYSGQLLSLSNFERDRTVYCKLMNMIEAQIAVSADEGIKQELQKQKADEEKEAKSGGCYVATCVYGSYDCPEVWVLRRFRDNVLANTFLGRTFIKAYYACSPSIVKWFGKYPWFVHIGKPHLDKMVAKLQNNGIENTPYCDKQWKGSKHK